MKKIWLITNKIVLNVAKGEVILFKVQDKILGTKVKFKLCRKQLHLPKPAKYLGLRTNQNLVWKEHVN